MTLHAAPHHVALQEPQICMQCVALCREAKDAITSGGPAAQPPGNHFRHRNSIDFEVPFAACFVTSREAKSAITTKRLDT